MTQLQVVPGQMRQAAAAVRAAGEGARDRGSSGFLGTAAGALPGADSAGYLTELGTGWDAEVEAWADAVVGFADGIEAATALAEAADGGIAGSLAGMAGLLGGGTDGD